VFSNLTLRADALYCIRRGVVGFDSRRARRLP
jgi:hypothetical protein